MQTLAYMLGPRGGGGEGKKRKNRKSIINSIDYKCVGRRRRREREKNKASERIILPSAAKSHTLKSQHCRKSAEENDEDSGAVIYY